MMRCILILILLSLGVSAQEIQDNTKVIAYRLGVMPINGSCNIGDYPKEISATGTTIQAMASKEPGLARKLFNLKREALANWPEQECDCKGQSYRKAEVIPNMYAIQINGYRDTLFTTKDNCYIYTREGKKYFDGESKLEVLLNPAFGEFITRDFEREINERIYDTIAVSKVLVGNKAVAGKTRKTFERDIAPFQMARTDSVFGKTVQIGKKFFIDNLEVNFGESGKVSEMRAHHPRGGNSKEISLIIDGIAIGDSEEKLLDRYTCSTVFRNWGASLKDPDDGYYYQVSFTNAKGFAFFHIWEKKVYAIEVTFFE